MKITIVFPHTSHCIDHVLTTSHGSSVLHRTDWAPGGTGFLRASPILSVPGEAQEPGAAGRLLHGEAAALYGAGGCGPRGPAQLSLDLSAGKQQGRGVGKERLDLADELFTCQVAWPMIKQKDLIAT